MDVRASELSENWDTVVGYLLQLPPCVPIIWNVVFPTKADRLMLMISARAPIRTFPYQLTHQREFLRSNLTCSRKKNRHSCLHWLLIWSMEILSKLCTLSR